VDPSLGIISVTGTVSVIRHSIGFKVNIFKYYEKQLPDTHNWSIRIYLGNRKHGPCFY